MSITLRRGRVYGILVTNFQTILCSVHVPFLRRRLFTWTRRSPVSDVLTAQRKLLPTDFCGQRLQRGPDGQAVVW